MSAGAVNARRTNKICRPLTSSPTGGVADHRKEVRQGQCYTLAATRTRETLLSGSHHGT